MFKKKYLGLAIAATLAAGSAQAELETSVTLKSEVAAFTKDGARNGQATSDRGDVFKFENTAQIFVNGDAGENSSWHGELKLTRDNKAVDGLDGHEAYTQQDFLRELYVDTKAGDWDVRIGKQQVVWGTADGMKLLDIINPTDFREMNQNTMAEARIPVWMVNAERYLDNGANVQVVVSQAKENVLSGLNRGIDTSVRSNSAMITGPQFNQIFGDATSSSYQSDAPFVMKGADSITGGFNGFLNIVPDLGSMARAFAYGFGSDMTDGNATDSLTGLSLGNFFPGMNPEGGYQPNVNDPNSMANGTMMNYFTVGGFAGMTMDQVASGMATMNAGGVPTASTWDAALPSNFQQFIGGVAQATQNNDPGSVTGAEMLEVGFVGFIGYNSNLASYSDGETNSAFEYMNMATFATFDAFSNAKSQYVYNMPDNTDANLAFRYKNTTADGLNYSLNYSYNYDKNPIINLSWRNNSGDLLETTAHEIQTQTPTGDLMSLYTLTLADEAGNSYGGAASMMSGEDRFATLRFEQTVERAHNVGAALDFAVDTETMGPVVLRGEFLYAKDVYSPVIDNGALSVGDMTNALTMHKGDRFKYVLGADVTVMTDMMVSAQFIQDRDLDYVDGEGSYYSNSQKYTTDYATMSLTNDFNKAEKSKNFYSLFFSKPFGESGEGRWNNIFIFEEGGGKWNRFDVEYGMTDQLIGTIEYNKYWGDENTTFGQFENASNIQVGLKYLLQ
jgi:hypothetical protein